jgi:hypothetical protein
MLACLTFGPQKYRLIRASCLKTSQFLSPGFNLEPLDRARMAQFRAYGGRSAPTILCLEDSATGILTCARPSDPSRMSGSD